MQWLKCNLVVIYLTAYKYRMIWVLRNQLYSKQGVKML